MKEPVNVYDFEEFARNNLPKMVFDYFASGANDEITLRKNHAAYDRIKLKYRVLKNISNRDLKTSILGHQVSMPVVIAPTAFHKMAHPGGEIATVKAAGNAGTIMILSTLSNTSIEEVLEAATGPVWFQLYVYKDRGETKVLVERAESAGCSAIVLTADAQIWGRREADIRNHFQLPENLSVKNLMPAGKDQFPKQVAESGLAAYVSSLFDQSLSWKDLDWLCSLTKLPVLLKGIVHQDDAKMALDYGVAGMVVSNHGGRQLDTAPATIEVLQEIVDVAGEKLEILIDGGIRRGTDILKAIALGAKAVSIGRPVFWGLAYDGQKGVERVLNILQTELDLAMGLCGFSSIAEINKGVILF
jgi:4-hydroxymandelate oxidase